MSKLQFPKGFLWGAATSAHQVEGNTTNDWSEWEKENAERLAKEAHKKFGHIKYWERLRPEAEDPKNYISGIACDHYNRFKEDFDLAKSLHHNAHRFSIEWSRIEPVEGQFDEQALNHYRDVLLALHERGLTPFVTLWHWTMPLWLRDKGGVSSKEFPVYFERYTHFVVSRLNDLVTFWIPLNEPTSVIAGSYTTGQWPPQKKSYFTAHRVYKILADSHKRAYRVIHEINPNAQVGLANLLHSFEPYHEHSFFDTLMIRFSHFFTNEYFLRLTKGTHDFLTAQYYFHNRFKFPRKVHLGDKPINDLGWEIYPKGIYNVLKELHQYNLPIYITENGLADAFDDYRIDFIRDHLLWIHQAIEDGVDVRGYFYWSLLDNFEWDKGFWPRFGLIAVDYEDQERIVRKAALFYAQICQENALEIEIEKSPKIQS
ncbi:MAG: glycoside hydrolase family 1 protein [Candidatus Moranbacteria bacterium]|nr:glycoside hydrolase family 1 protein [Candidatus Moranbacteria bacterium]